MGFKETLKAELAYQDMLVKELAEKSGVHKRAIDNYLNQQGSIPSADAAVKIARVLGVTVEYLITGENRPAPLPLDTALSAHVRLLRQLNDRDRRVLFEVGKALKNEV